MPEASTAAALLDRLGRPGGVRLGTTYTVAVSRLPTGLNDLDALLDGGLPRGRVTELAGAPSTGRTGLACAIAAGATAHGEVIAWVDPEDVLEADAAYAAGVTLARMLWVRPRDVRDALRATELLLGAGGFGLVVLDCGQGAGRGGLLAWPRLVRVAEKTRSTLLVLSSEPQVGAQAALGLVVTGRRVCWSKGPGQLLLLDGIEARLRVARSRLHAPGNALTVRQACA